MSLFTKNFIPILFSLFLTVVLLCGAPHETFARGGGRHSSGGSVAVGGYTRSNGTYVSGYNRSSPSSRSSFGSSYGSSYYSSGYHSSGGHSSRSYSSNYSGRSTINSHLGVSRHSPRTLYSSGTYKSGYAKVERSETAKRQFLRQQGLTQIPAGYHIDHIRPLSQGGSDTPSNMQLLSVEAHHQKTAAERRHY